MEKVDINELFTDMSVKEKIIPYKGKDWKFEVRELTWQEKGTIITAATKMLISKGKKSEIETRFDVNVYNRLYLLKGVKKAPFPMNDANLLKISHEFGELMVKYLVEKTSETIGEVEEKNSETP